ncbi:RRM domain-containing protein [Caenorhabditis elegans]|nr:RRM domain-containing protein [Caenorhabditis elegans]CDH93365.1 RRM domain-containing protein [Caenorhabditis elegans]|eukprot:NP_001294565.1 RNP (RRM RNA binding domain) containing [Caenorhabditis elegans]
MVFTQFGEIIQLMSFRKEKMRGQAHIVFKEVSSASNALRALQGFPFYGKPMRIQYAREDSDVISRAKGTFVEKRQKSTKIAKKPYEKPAKNGKSAAEPTQKEPQETDGPGLPNNILFCSNIPEGTEPEQIQTIFSQFPGLREVRWMPNTKDFAFIEYESEDLSEPARQALDNFRITPTQQITVKFASK